MARHRAAAVVMAMGAVPVRMPADAVDVLTGLASRDPQRRARAVQDALASDWPQLRAAAETHGVAPLLYWRLQERPPVPQDSQFQQLRRTFEIQSLKNLALTGELVSVARALATAGVPAFAFKGPAFALVLHGNLALRDSSDLDLLIPREKLETARGVLQQCGYRRLKNYSPRQERSLERNECQLDFVNGAGQLLDLHWQIVPRHFGIQLDFAALWERRRTVALGGGDIAIFSPEDIVLAIALHGSKHLWSRIAWLWDLAEAASPLVAQPPSAVEEPPRNVGATPPSALDWESLLRRAAEIRALTMLLFGLQQVRDLLDVRLPDCAERAIAAHPQLRSIRRGGVAQERWSQTLRLLDTSAQRATCLARFLFTSGVAEWSMVHLPDALFPLYTPIRWARIAGLARQVNA